MKLVLATRKSPLALAQAGLVAAHLGARLGAQCELLKVETTGDRKAEWSLEEKGGKGLFTKELEEALLRGDADVAVHSAKDLPGESVAGLATAGYLPREDPRDVLVVQRGIDVPRLLATGSPRRRLQASLLYSKPEFTAIRGNVDTRLRKIAEQKLADGTILAAAGLRRLGISSWDGLEFRVLGPEQMVPAVGQGAIALQCRAADEGKFSGALDAAAARSLSIERAVQAVLGAGCQTALGVHVVPDALFLFHEDCGLMKFPLSPADFDSPRMTADRVVAAARLR